MEAPHGTKQDQGKAPISLIPTSALTQLAQVLAFGAQKYSPNNWRNGIEYNRLYDAAQRHLMAWQAGQDLDPESGLPHLAHVMANISFLIEMILTRPDLDDRYKAEK